MCRNTGLAESHSPVDLEFSADEATSVAVAIRDIFGNRLLTGKTPMEGIAEQDAETGRALYNIEVDHNQSSYIEDYLDGTYLVKFNATIAGQYSVMIEAVGTPIGGMPMTVTIVPANSSIYNTIIRRSYFDDGPYDRYTVATTEVGLSIETVDSFGNFRGMGGDDIVVRATCVGSWWNLIAVTCEKQGDVPLEVTDNDDGTYIAASRVYIAGNYTMDVFLFGHLIPTSQLPLYIFAAASAPDNCVVGAGVINGTVVAGTPMFYEVVDNDQYGNRNLEGAAIVLLLVTGYTTESPIPRSSIPALAHPGEGLYTIETVFYTVVDAALIEQVNVTSDASNCSAVADPAMCSAVLTDPLLCEEYDVPSATYWGAECPCSCIEGNPTWPSPVTTLQTARALVSWYLVEISSFSSNSHNLTFLVQGSAIGVASLLVVPAGADPTMSVLHHPDGRPTSQAGTPFYFELSAYDVYGNKRTMGGDHLCLNMLWYGCREMYPGVPGCTVDMEYHIPIEAAVVDFGTGEYTITASVTLSGEHLAMVNVLPLGAVDPVEQEQMFLDGRAPEVGAAANVSFECAPGPHWDVLPTIGVSIVPGPTDPVSSTAQGSGLVGGVAGRNISFSIQARDQYLNKQRSGLDESETFSVDIAYRRVNYTETTTETTTVTVTDELTNQTVDQTISTNTTEYFYRFEDAIYITNYVQKIQGNLTIPGSARAWNTGTLEGMAKMRQIELGVASCFGLASSAVDTQDVEDASVMLPGDTTATVLIRIYYTVNYVWDGVGEPEDKTLFIQGSAGIEWEYKQDLQRKINQAGSVVVFELDELEISTPAATHSTEVSYSAETEVMYSPDASGEYVVQYLLPGLLDLEGFEHIRISVLLDNQHVSGSPEEALLLADVLQLSMNASMSEASGPGVDGRFEAGSLIEFMIQLRDWRGIDLVPSKISGNSVDLEVESPGLAITLVDQLDGRWVGSYQTNASGLYEVRLLYTTGGARVDGVYQEGAKYLISGQPYSVVIYASGSHPPNCEAVKVILTETEAADCTNWTQGNGTASATSVFAGEAADRDACLQLVAVQHPVADGITYPVAECGCVFPFAYTPTGGSLVNYTECTGIHSDLPWCATAVDPVTLELVRGQFENCADICPGGRYERDCFAEFGWSGTDNSSGWQTCRFVRSTVITATRYPLDELEYTVAGRPYTFLLQSTDVFGNLQDNPAFDDMDEYIVGAEGVEQTIEALGEGLYQVSLTAETIGMYNISIALQDKFIKNPNFTLAVETSTISPSTSVPTGSGISLTAVAVRTEFRVLLRDLYENVARCSADVQDTVRMVGFELDSFGTVCEPNTLVVMYNTTVSGTFTVNISATGASERLSAGLFGGNTYTIVVEPAPVSAATSTIFGLTDVQNNVLPGSTMAVALDLRDRFGNPTELRTDHRGVDLSAGLRMEWTHSSRRDNDTFEVCCGWIGEICPPCSNTSLVEVLEGLHPRHSGITSTVVPGGSRGPDSNFSTTFIPLAYGPYMYRALAGGMDLQGSPGVFFVDSLSAPVVASARLSSSALDLEITFESLTNRARMGSYIWPCDTIIDAIHKPVTEDGGGRIVDPMPSGLSCRWRTSQILQIDLTSVSTGPAIARAGVRIFLLPKVLRADENSRATNNVAVVDIRASDGLAAAANLGAGLLVSSCTPCNCALASCHCDSIILDASSSTGSGGRPLTFHWSRVIGGYPQALVTDNGTHVETDEGATLPHDAMSGLYSSSTSPWYSSAPSGSTVAVPRELLVAGIAYNFTVTVTNDFGSASTTHALVTTTARPIPSVVLPNSDRYTIRAGLDMHLEPSVNISACYSGDDAAIVWQWQLLTGATMVQPMVLSPSKTIFIARALLTPGSVYELLVTAHMATDPTLVGYDTATIEVERSGVYASLTSDLPNSISVTRAIFLDATGSYDIDYPPTADDGGSPTGLSGTSRILTYSWRMQQYGTDGVYCSNTDEDELRFIMNTVDSTLNIPAGLLLPDQQCEFTVTVRLSGGGIAPSSAFASYVVTLVNALISPPNVRVRRMLPPETQGRVTAGTDSVVLEGLLLDPAPTLLANVATACQWNMREGLLPDGRVASDFERTINSAISRLILPAGSLMEGQLYYFRFSCYVGGHEGFAEHSFETNSPPKLGTLSRQTEMADPWTVVVDGSFVMLDLKTDGWADDVRDSPFMYVFTSYRRCDDTVRADCENGHTHPVVLGHGTQNIRDVAIAVSGNATVTISVTATDQLSSTSVPVLQNVSIVAVHVDKSHTAAHGAAQGILDTYMVDAVSTGDIGMIMQLASVVAELFRNVDVASRRSLMLASSEATVGRKLQVLSDIRTIQLQVLSPMVTVASATIEFATENSLYQYLSALAELSWVSRPATGAELVDFEYEEQASQFLSVVLNQSDSHGRLVKRSRAAATRAASGIIQGLPARTSDFGPGLAMALAQIHYNDRSSFAGVRTMFPNYAVLSCEPNTWSINYVWTTLDGLSTGIAFSEIEFISVSPREWTVIRMGGGLSGSEATCHAGDVLDPLTAAFNGLARAAQHDTVCGQDPLRLQASNFIHSSVKLCLDPAVHSPVHSAVLAETTQVNSTQAVSIRAPLPATAEAVQAIVLSSVIWSDPQLWAPAGDFISPVMVFSIQVAERTIGITSLLFNTSLLSEFSRSDDLAPQCSSLVMTSRGLAWTGDGCTIMFANDQDIGCQCVWGNSTSTATAAQQFAVLAAPSQCQLLTNCFDCLSAPACGWCGSTSTCFEGNRDHAFFPAICPDVWSHDSCPCDTFSACDGCLAPAGDDPITTRQKRACGFCPRLDACLEVNETETCGEWPTGVGWIDMNTTCPTPCNSAWGLQHGYIMNDCGPLSGSCINYTICECVDGRFGNDCDGICPGGLDSVCSGEGECDDGNLGSGDCTCDVGSGYGGDDCRDCDAAHWGADCNSTCRGIIASLAYPIWHPLYTEVPCNRHGACDYGETGTGVCFCE